MLVLGFVLLNGALVAGSQPKGSGTPENITVQMIDSKTVEVFWSSAWKNVERYDVTYNPTENRVVSQAAGNSHSIILRELRPNTQYQVTVTAVVGGKNYKSRRLVFRTSAEPNDSINLEEVQPIPTKPTKSRKSYLVTPEIINPDPTAIGSKYTPPTSTTVRGVEIGLVLLALVVWIIAISLFFHRWGKIRMLLPYQPDYKTQQSLKVPGTGTTIVSGCTGNNSSQGNQDGPGCVQHLRWSTRFLDEGSTAKKCSPSRRPPRGTSAVFPASPSFCYARTSSECDSPRIMRHARSHGEFPTESIPLCQVNQPRSESPQNIISITVPVIASNVNEKAQNKKNVELKSEQKKNLDDNAIIKFEESEFSTKDKNDFSSSLSEDISRNDPLGLYYSRSFYRSTQTPNGRERNEREKEREDNPSELEPLFFIESTDLSFQMSPTDEVKSPQEGEKPRRYSRSSLKKQKVRLYDDRDLNLCKNVPIYECESNSQEKKPPNSDSEKVQKPKHLKTQELRRKAFLRKVSLQDTYLNYNQDYWLDFKKSGRFHKSIDLGCFGTQEKCNNKTDTQGHKKSPDVQEQNSIWGEQFAQQIAPNNQIQSLAIKSQSKLPLYEGSLKKSDSDPIIFPSKCSCENCRQNILEKSGNDSNELLVEIIAKCEKKETDSKSSWFFLPSNENIPLFSERNGLIETDFDMLNDMLDEECLLLDKFSNNAKDDTENKVFCTRETKSSESESRGNDFEASMDFPNFYEIKLTQSSESENENLKKSRTFNFDGGEAFFETFRSGSGDSDVSFKETDPMGVKEVNHAGAEALRDRYCASAQVLNASGATGIQCVNSSFATFILALYLLPNVMRPLHI